jgi:hypothetical protein
VVMRCCFLAISPIQEARTEVDNGTLAPWSPGRHRTSNQMRGSHPSISLALTPLAVPTSETYSQLPVNNAQAFFHAALDYR